MAETRAPQRPAHQYRLLCKLAQLLVLRAHGEEVLLHRGELIAVAEGALQVLKRAQKPLQRLIDAVGSDGLPRNLGAQAGLFHCLARF